MLAELPHRPGDEEGHEGAPAVDLGTSASSMSPKEAPRLDDVAPGYGVAGLFSREAVDETHAALFRVPAAKIQAVAAVLAEYGGEVWHDQERDRWIVALPRPWVGDEVVFNAEALRRRRLDADADNR